MVTDHKMATVKARTDILEELPRKNQDTTNVTIVLRKVITARTVRKRGEIQTKGVGQVPISTMRNL